MDRPGETSAARLLARPGTEQVVTPQLDLFVVRDFLSRDECAALVALIEAQHRPSTLADPNGDETFRTSSTCDLPPHEPVVVALAARLTETSGIDPAHAEPLQGQRYEVGQQFKAHTDYFQPGSVDYDLHCSVAGQRTWTFMAYLNEVEAGGETHFASVGREFRPEAGMLLVWDNHGPDGALNPSTLHHARPVRAGMKYVITQWYRERPWGWATTPTTDMES
ncbi:prolyl hydroxylase family protein [Nocardioides currus]|uniref:Oxygenase n=1 Tax=Nocardioides currus TaxID=2133958 RepID=A0A2R7YTR3_9ACTN|nr:2OG-Fe(II) oxygenase [Nocardioides currus]PUA79770.1 oxygenase [Nocardioides currus]